MLLHNFSHSTTPHVISKFRDSSKQKSVLKCSECWRETSPTLTRPVRTQFSACTGRIRHERVGGSWLRARSRCHRSAGLSRSVCLCQPTLRGGDTKGRRCRLPFHLWSSFCYFPSLPLLWSEMRVGCLTWGDAACPPFLRPFTWSIQPERQHRSGNACTRATKWRGHLQPARWREGEEQVEQASAETNRNLTPCRRSNKIH